jgi:hypothetical protein
VYEQLVKEIEGILERYRGRFVDLEDLRDDFERLGCEYWVDEYPEVYGKAYYRPLSIRLESERAHDLAKCEVGGREVEVIIRMVRGVVDLPTAYWYFYIHDYEVKPPKERK